MSSGLPSPFFAHFTDLGFLFGAMHGADAGVALSTALASMGIERSGGAYAGVDDAVTLATLWTEAARRVRASRSVEDEVPSGLDPRP